MKYLKRILACPFMFLLFLLTALIHAITRTCQFMKFGGEVITYSPEINKGTIEAVYDELRKQSINSELEFSTKLYSDK